MFPYLGFPPLDQLVGGFKGGQSYLFCGTCRFIEDLVHQLMVKASGRGNVAYMNNSDYSTQGHSRRRTAELRSYWDKKAISMSLPRAQPQHAIRHYPRRKDRPCYDDHLNAKQDHERRIAEKVRFPNCSWDPCGLAHEDVAHHCYELDASEQGGAYDCKSRHPPTDASQ